MSSFRRLVVARFLSEAGSVAALFVGIWGTATFRLHATPGQAALVAAVWGLVSLTGNLIGGVLVDRFNPRRVLIVGECIAIPATLSLIWAASMPALIALVIPTSLAGALIATAVTSFPPFVAEGEADLTRANSGIEMAFALSFIAGPALGAAIAKTAGLHWIFVVNAASSLVALALLAGIRIRPAGERARAGFLDDVRDGVRVAVRNRQARFVMIISLAVWLSFGSYMALEPLFYREVLHAGPGLLGVVLTVFGSGVFAGAWLSGRIPARLLSLRVLAGLGIVIGAGEIAYTATSHLALVFGGNILWGLAIGAVAPMARTILHATVPETHVGRVMGSMGVAQRFGTLVPLVFIGAVASSAGVQPVLVGAGVGMVLFGAITLPRTAAADAERRAGILNQPDVLEIEVEPIYKGLA